MEQSQRVPSPCISICRMNDATGLCEGCLRTLDEIAAWSVLDDDARRAVWDAIAHAPRALRRLHRLRMATVDWYFDFVSPFAYLQSEQLHLLGPEDARPLPAGAVRGTARGARAQGTGGDPAQARLHVSLRVVASAAARHPVQDAARASVQSAAAPAACARVRLRARRRARDLPLRVARRSPARPADRMGRARRATCACPTRSGASPIRR